MSAVKRSEKERRGARRARARVAAAERKAAADARWMEQKRALFDAPSDPVHGFVAETIFAAGAP